MNQDLGSGKQPPLDPAWLELPEMSSDRGPASAVPIPAGAEGSQTDGVLPHSPTAPPLPWTTLNDYWQSTRGRKERTRQVRRAAILFILTCLSTFFVGMVQWIGMSQVFSLLLRGQWELLGLVARAEFEPWTGLTYMLCVMGILTAHEMGHFLASVWYRTNASFPYFIPFPVSPAGTMGAVILTGMPNKHRQELFDMGIAGPLAGLVIALPVTLYGLYTAEVFVEPVGPAAQTHEFHDPLVVKLLQRVVRPDIPAGAPLQLNAYLMAGWVGFLVTGLNFMPLSQLDGGHTLYALFGRRAHGLAEFFWWLALFLLIYMGLYHWLLMLIMVAMLGVRHPPTMDDRRPLDATRWWLGFVCLILIPVLTFPPQAYSVR